MSFFTIQIPVRVTAEGDLPSLSRTWPMIVRIGPLGANATSEDAVRLLAEKLERALNTIDIGDEE